MANPQLGFVGNLVIPDLFLKSGNSLGVLEACRTWEYAKK